MLGRSNKIAIGILISYIVFAVGLLISALVDSQVAALLISAVVFMIPVIMLSGMIFPIDNMPAPLRVLSGIIPARWYISAMRKLMIQQLPIGYVIRETIVLLGMTILFISLAISKFNLKK